MALNYSHMPIFPLYNPEDNMWSPMSMVNHEDSDDWTFDFRWDTVDLCCPPEPNHRDVVDLLPSDPFDMDVETTFLTAIARWLEDLVFDYGRNNTQENYELLSEWSNAFTGNSVRVEEEPCVVSHSFPDSVMWDEELNVAINENISCVSEPQFEEKVLEGAAKSEGIPFEALVSILNFLGVKDLLSMEMVCKSLCSTIRSEQWLWRSIRIDQPLNEKITDDSLLQLASRSAGRLQCLSLVECTKVTDDGIRRILETNPQLTKLFVPGCTRLTIEGTLKNIRIHNSNKGFPGIKHLRIGHLFGVTHTDFKELKSLLGFDELQARNHHKPHFYSTENVYLPFEDDRTIDIEMCPRCEKFRLVYDCPSETCQVNEPSGSKICRACTICIARCVQCGRCIEDNEYQETFLLDLKCSDCFKEVDGTFGEMHEVSHHH